ncbi:MAG: hypothetical protein DRP75_03175 [Candidatus Omnitrophota bacterium]|nr:MAG: hypothetical protein DRP75_03175 [Candidatus Omnitrophota bacterium]
MREIEKNSVPQGFKFAGVHSGIKKSKRDLGLIYSCFPATSAGLFTTNRMQSGTVQVCKRNINNKVRAVLVNSGNANCATRDAFKSALLLNKSVAQELGIKESEVLSASTGVIGIPLPVEKIKKKIPFLVKQLKEDSREFAEAILTTDKQTKQIALEIEIKGKKVVVAGVAKGSGMISPHLATMLCFLTSDINIHKRLLYLCLKEAVDKSFNLITIDGQMSTNDTVLCLANAQAGNEKIVSGVGRSEKKELSKFQEALNYITTYLSREIVRDGEGATKLIEVVVRGAKRNEDAERVARQIANSSLIKAMFYGRSFNYGRIAAAIGASVHSLDTTEIYLSDKRKKIRIFKDGHFLERVDREGLAKILEGKEIEVIVDLREGGCMGKILGCDLSEEYIRINARY